MECPGDCKVLGKGNLALDALVVLGHAEIFQGIPKFDRIF